MAQTVKNLSAIQETQVQSLGREDPLEEGMTIHSSTFAWRIPWAEEPGRLQSIGSHRVGHDCSNLAHSTHLTIAYPSKCSVISSSKKPYLTQLCH